MAQESDGESFLAELQAALDHSAASLTELSESLQGTSADVLDPESWLEIVVEIGRRIKRFHDDAAVVSSLLGLSSAQARIELFLTNHVGESVSAYELFGAAGRIEWARRLRELRTETGYRISYQRGNYSLDSYELDLERAERWRIRNEIRRSPGSGDSRLLKYMQAVSPHPVSKDDLIYVSKILSAPRRVRELAEEGWEISSQYDDPTLEAGSYRLESLVKGPARAPESTLKRKNILERDDHRCLDCGDSPPEVRLQVHHVHNRQHGGSDNDENLRTLCSACHAGVHALADDQVKDELLHPSSDPDRPF